MPADYIKEASIARLAAEGQRLMQKHRAALNEIEKRFGVPASVVLAIWGRETDFGRYTLPYDTLRVVATQAYVGRRKDQYRTEFILALKMLGEGAVTRKDMRSSWAGATGLTQFLPSEYYKHGIDFDGDGRIDIWHSVPDALASAAQQLVNKGWQPGLRWAYEVRAPANVDCSMGVPEVTKPISEWLRAGFVPVRGEKLSAAEQAQPASLLQPEGIYGPAFLTTKNYFVIKEYNFSDLYVLFVGHLSRSHDEPIAIRDALVGLEAVAHERCRGDAAPFDAHRALQGQARRQGRHADPRGARCLSEIRRAQGRLLAERSGAAVDERGAITKKPGRELGRVSNSARSMRRSLRLVADLDVAEAPAVAVPETLANHAAGRGALPHRPGHHRPGGWRRSRHRRSRRRSGRLQRLRQRHAGRSRASERATNRQSLRPRRRQLMSCSCLELSWSWRLQPTPG